MIKGLAWNSSPTLLCLHMTLGKSLRSLEKHGHLVPANLNRRKVLERPDRNFLNFISPSVKLGEQHITLPGF